jgi:hypothetical protein
MKNTSIRFILGIVAGLIAGVSAIMAFETVSHSLFTLPEGMDPMDPETGKYVMDNAPIFAIFMIPLGWIAGAFLASLTASLVCKSRARMYFFIFAGLITAASVFNLINIPSPWWMWAMALLFIFPASLLGSRLANR